MEGEIPLNILLMTIGSAGDVNPFLTLGCALQARSHRPILVTNEHFRTQAEHHGLEFLPLGTEDEYRAAIGHPDLFIHERALRCWPSTVCSHGCA